MKVLVILIILGICVSHKVADDEFEDLFEISAEEEQLIKQKNKQVPKGETELEEQLQKPEIKYFDDTPEFKSSMEKYIYYGLKYKVEIMLIVFTITFVFNLILGKKVNRNLANAFH